MQVATIPMVEDSMQQAHLHRAHQQGARASQAGQSMSERMSHSLTSPFHVEPHCQVSHMAIEEGTQLADPSFLVV